MSKAKVVPINKKEFRKSAEATQKYDFEGKMKKFDEYFHDPEKEHKIFTDLGFSWHDDEEFCFACDRNGSCPEHPDDNGKYLNGRLNLDSTPLLKKIRIVVDLIEIVDAMESHGYGDESMSYVDTETGEVEYVTSEILRLVESGGQKVADALPDWQQSEIDIAKMILNNDNRFVLIPRLESSVGFKFMENFIDELENENITRCLVQALRRSRPFRGFKDVLSDYPETLDQWYEFKNKRMRHEAVKFLSSVKLDRIELVLPSNI